MTDKQVDEAITMSNSTYSEWKKTSYKDRASLLHRVAKLMRTKKPN
jgi:succinate-semialdehyde dehydrogenase/glutarate-semialdehyde dehydrogenase